ncbi:MAG: PIG-L family deacetylase [Clostridiales Family XIII bacterium]|jgi:LmbE family N-acetylglucosaminyl deacetylase|nr:PIG-L family deacetylase [Clostridiales Family XIII bacterium]
MSIVDKKILIVSPHMDDETLGGGGLLVKAADVCWLNISNSLESYEYHKLSDVSGYDKVLVEKREAQRLTVISEYGFKKAFDLKLKPTALSEYDEGFIINRIRKIIEEIKPEVLIIPFSGDIHSDHKRVHNLLLPFTKGFRYPYIKIVLEMEILSETEFSDKAFKPNFFINITETLNKKIEIMQIYEDELKPFPFPRSIENIKALAMLRGSQVGVKYAEGFRILKMVVDNF